MADCKLQWTWYTGGIKAPYYMPTGTFSDNHSREYKNLKGNSKGVSKVQFTFHKEI